MKYIVSEEHEFVYFVVQKAACTSIKTALLPLFDTAPSDDGSAKEGVLSEPDVHRFFDTSEQQINKKQLIRKLDGEYKDFFKFAFVRNPWDRLVSCYMDKLADESRPGMRSPPEFASHVYPGMPFPEFVSIVHETPDERINIHLKSQCSAICGWGYSDRHIIADFVGQFENLAADFYTVAQTIGDGRVRQLPHLMQAKNRKTRSYAEFYDDRLRDLVYERYREDVEKLGYHF